MLLRSVRGLLLANEDWYTRFCEGYTHVTPQTKPNIHNTGGQAYAGGVYQPEGLKNTLGELATVLGSVSMIVCQYFNFSDLFEQLSEIVGSADDESINDGS